MPDAATELLFESLRLAVVLAAPVAVAALVSGVLSGFMQSVTTWSDAALTHAPRLAAVVLAWVLTGSWVSRQLVAFAERAWNFGGGGGGP